MKNKLILTIAITAVVTIGSVAPVSAKSSVTRLRGGLFCRDLYRLGYSYGDALRYWNYWDQPDNMDADFNGIPCETVYSAAAVKRYFPRY